MGGITSGNMPVFVVENRLEGNEAYCILNEGIGKVLRFGAYSQEVVDRLDWIKMCIRDRQWTMPIKKVIRKLVKF